MTTTIYPCTEYDRPEGPPPADAWFYQVGETWAAVVADHEREHWWTGDDPAEMGAPDIWEYPIDQIPPSGTLRWRDADGNEHNEVIA